MKVAQVKEDICWWCENGFDDSPLDGQEMVIVNGEKMHAVCAKANGRFNEDDKHEMQQQGELNSPADQLPINTLQDRLHYLPRMELVNILENFAGIQCGDKDDETLRMTIVENVKNGTLPENMVDELCHEYIADKAQSAKWAKNGDHMQKTAQNQVPESRQRNEWVRGTRNKFNRVVNGFNEGTPWRIDRDKFFNFTHYYTDAISFDADPNRVYSGEAIWRMYIMDKFTNEYMNKEGKWVGGYINDRFYVFPDAGTPANPDAPRDGGNQMGLPPGVKSRKPRPHQYSTERRLEEARGNKGNDLEAFAEQNNQLIKIANKNVAEKEEDKVYAIFRDVLDMREAGIAYDTILEKVAEHYDTSILNVAQIDKTAQGLKTKHSGIAYELNKTAGLIPNANYKLARDVGTQDGKTLAMGTCVRATEVPNQFTVTYPATQEYNVVLANVQDTDFVADGDDTGLLDDGPKVQQAPQQAQPAETNFAVNEVAPVESKEPVAQQF